MCCGRSYEALFQRPWTLSGEVAEGMEREQECDRGNEGRTHRTWELIVPKNCDVSFRFSV